MKWHIGQDIVCVDDSSYSGAAAVELRNDHVYTIKGLGEPFCGCNNILIDVGHRSVSDFSRCPKCRSSAEVLTTNRWYSESRFRPLDELADISELTEMLAEPQLEKVTGF